MPELLVGNRRINQKFDRHKENIQFLFPKKWGINKYINQAAAIPAIRMSSITDFK